MTLKLKYVITQSGKDALRDKFSSPIGDWHHRYAHILLSDFVNLHPEGLDKPDIASLYGTIGLSHFEELHREGYFRAIEA